MQPGMLGHEGRMAQQGAFAKSFSALSTTCNIYRFSQKCEKIFMSSGHNNAFFDPKFPTFPKIFLSRATGHEVALGCSPENMQKPRQKAGFLFSINGNS